MTKFLSIYYIIFVHSFLESVLFRFSKKRFSEAHLRFSEAHWRSQFIGDQGGRRQGRGRQQWQARCQWRARCKP
jgi:hypothetical protein